MTEKEAQLQLQFERQTGHTSFRCMRQDPPWKIVRGFTLEDGESLVHLNNVSGGIFGGDRLKLGVHVHPGAQAQITTTGATRIYRTRPEASDALLVSEFHVGRDALLEYLPDALIPFRSARAIQRTTYSLEVGSTLFCWETIAPGRAAAGELFAYDRLKLSTSIRVAGRPVYSDRMLLEPAKGSMRSTARFGHSNYLVTFLAIKSGSTAAETLSLAQLIEDVVYSADFEGLSIGKENMSTAHWGVTTLPAHGVLVRGVTRSAVEIPSKLQALWSRSKQHLCGRVAIAPRKTH